MRGGSREAEGGADVILTERGEIGKDFGSCGAFGETGEHRAQCETAAFEHRLAADDMGGPDINLVRTRSMLDSTRMKDEFL